MNEKKREKKKFYVLGLGQLEKKQDGVTITGDKAGA